MEQAGRNGGAGERHTALVERVRAGVPDADGIVDAFARVPRHVFLPGVPLDAVYSDDAVVTRDEGGVPTSSSTQPSLMARMLAQLDVRPGLHVLEVGAGTGYNAAILAALGAAVTTVELQPDVAAAAARHLRAAGIPVTTATPSAGEVRVVTGDGGHPPGGPYDRAIVTAGCWSLPPGLVDALADGGVLVAPLRINGVELALALRRDGAALRGSGGLPCGFMPLQGDQEQPLRWELGAGGHASADIDLGDEGRGALDRLLAAPGREVDDPLAPREGEHLLDALLWLGLQGDPLVGLMRPREGRPAWTVGLYVLPASLLELTLGAAFDAVAAARLYGGEGALRTCTAEMEAWRAAGAPGPERLGVVVEPSADRTGSSLPFPTADGGAAMIRGAHRWTLRFA